MTSEKNQPVQSESPTAQADCECGELLFLDSLDRAVVSASAAADADISIDNVLLVALGDSLNGAVVSASAALDASVSTLESHDVSSIMFVIGIANVMHLYSSTDFRKCNSFFQISLVYF